MIRFADSLFQDGSRRLIGIDSPLSLDGAIGSALGGSITIIGPGSFDDEVNGRLWALNIHAANGTAIFEVDDTIHISGLAMLDSVTDAAMTTQANARLTLEDVSITSSPGGAIHHRHGSLEINDSVIAFNGTTGEGSLSGGGAILIDSASSTPATAVISDSLIRGNKTSLDGGAILNVDGGLSISRSEISGNTARGNGGGLASWPGARTSIYESTIVNNTAESESGGGIYGVNTQITIGESIIESNDALDYGGGVAVVGNSGETILNVRNTTLAGNQASTGGGIDNRGGTLTVIGSTLSSNESRMNGGAIATRGTSPETVIVNSTLSGNNANRSGGGVWQESGTLVLTNATVVLNQSNMDGVGDSPGGGLAVSDGNSVKLVNTIVAGNTIATDTSSDAGGEQHSDIHVVTGENIDLANSFHNLIGDFNSAGGLVNDPLQTGNANLVGNLDPDEGQTVWPLDRILYPELADNLGGLTAVHALQVDSPAIDAGSFFRPSASADPLRDAQINPTSRLLTDQRGHPFQRADSRPLSDYRGPANNAVDQPTQPYLYWRKVGDASTYRFVISESEPALPTGIEPLVNSPDIKVNAIVDGTNFTPDPDALQPSTTYYWQYQTYNADSGESGRWSRPLQFTTSSKALPPATARVIRDMDEEDFFAVDIGSFEVQQRPLFTKQELVVSTLTDIVDGDYSHGELSLREAVEIANLRSDHNSIRFLPSLFPNDNSVATITVLSALKIDSDLTISAPISQSSFSGVVFTKPRLAISGGDQTRIVEIGPTADVHLSGIEFTEGRGELQTNVDFDVFSLDVAGGALFNAGNTSLRDVRFTNNASVTTNDPRNIAGGGAINNIGTMTIRDSAVLENTAAGNGGGIRNHFGTITIGPDVDIGDNTAGEGGGIYTTGDVTIIDSNIFRNRTLSANGGGGGINIAESSTMVEIRRSSISSNWVNASSTDTDNSRGFGGGIYSIGSLHMYDTSVGGTSLQSANLVTAMEVAAGGGLYLNPQNGASIIIERSTISHNQASGDGNGNSNPEDAHGGGIFIASGSAEGNDDPLGASGIQIINSTISHNETVRADRTLGGGIFVAKEWRGAEGRGAIPNIIDSTIAFNVADRLGDQYPTPIPENRHTAVAGGGIFADGWIAIGNSIVSDNSLEVTGLEIPPPAPGSEIYLNLFSDRLTSPGLSDAGKMTVTSKFLVRNRDIQGITNARKPDGSFITNDPILVTGDPQLGPLDLQNGGFTATHKLNGAFNDAVDVGNRFGLLDQRGYPVTDIVDIPDNGGIADLGAYESSEQVRIENFSADIRGASQFGSGDAFIAGIGFDDGKPNSLVPIEPGFLGLEFDVGPTALGPGIGEGLLGDLWGAEVTAEFDGRLGIEYGYYVNSGSVDTFYDGLFAYSIDNSAADDTFSIQTGATFTEGQFFTASPTVSAYADLVFELNALLAGEACIVGCADFSFPININPDPLQLFSINRQLEVENSSGEMVPAFHLRNGADLQFDTNGNAVLTADSNGGLNPPAFDGDIQFGDAPLQKLIERAEDQAVKSIVKEASQARTDIRKAEIDLESGKDASGNRLSQTQITERENTIETSRAKQKSLIEKSQQLVDGCVGTILTACISEVDGDTLGVEVKLGLGATVGAAGVNLEVGSVAVTLPDIQLADTEFDSKDGKLSATTDDFVFGSEQDAKRNIAKVQVDAAALLGARFGLPLGRYSASLGPIDVEATTVSYNVGPQFSITQSVEVEPFFDDEHQASFEFFFAGGEVIDVSLDGAKTEIMSGQSVSFIPGATVEVDTRGKDVDILPSMKVGNRFSNDIGLDFDVVGLLEVLRLSLNAFGEEVFDVGPLYRDEHSVLDALGIGAVELASIFDETFNLPAQQNFLMDSKDRDGDGVTDEPLIIKIGPGAELPSAPIDGKTPGGAYPLVSGERFLFDDKPVPEEGTTVYFTLPLVDENGVVGRDIHFPSPGGTEFIVPPYRGITIELKFLDQNLNENVAEYEVPIEGTPIPFSATSFTLKGFEELIDSRAIFGIKQRLRGITPNLLATLVTDDPQPISLVYNVEPGADAEFLGNIPNRRLTPELQQAVERQTNAFVVDNDLAFDIDNNGVVSLTTDGLLLSRFFEGTLGDALIVGAIAADSRRRDPTISHAEEIERYINEELLQTGRMDVDGSATNGDSGVNPSVDGVLILRRMAGIGLSQTSGLALTDGVSIPGQATRRLPEEIAAFIDGRRLPKRQESQEVMRGRSHRSISPAERIAREAGDVTVGSSPWAPVIVSFNEGQGTYSLETFGDSENFEDLYLTRSDGVLRDLIRTGVQDGRGRTTDFVESLPSAELQALLASAESPSLRQFDQFSDRFELETVERTLGLEEPIFLQLPFELSDRADEGGIRVPDVGGYKFSFPTGHRPTQIAIDTAVGGNAFFDHSLQSDGLESDFLLVTSDDQTFEIQMGVPFTLPQGTETFELFPRGLNDPSTFQNENQSQPDLDIVIGLVLAGDVNPVPQVVVDVYSDADGTPSNLSRTHVIDDMPRQLISLATTSTTLKPSDQFSVDVGYRVSEIVAQTPSAATIEIHYDSSLVKFNGITGSNLVVSGLVNSDTAIGPEDIEYVSDGDLSTDRVIIFSWIDSDPDVFSEIGRWAQRDSLSETRLATINFQALESEGATKLRVTGEPSAGFEFDGSALGLEIIDVPLIVDTVSDIDDGIFSVGNLSLREAIGIANTDARPRVIIFDTTLFNQGPASIVLSGGELMITDDVSIVGPGAERLSIDGNRQSRLFNIDDGVDSRAGSVAISGVTLLKGQTIDSVGGGAIYSLEDLTVSESVITDNASLFNGGAIQSGDPSATATGTRLAILDSTISQNTAIDGGAVFSFGSVLDVRRSTFASNAANLDLSGDGGAIFNHDGDATILNSTFFDNSATKGGGAIWHWEIGDVSIRSSTFVNNLGDSDASFGGAGGAINVILAQTPPVAHNTIFAGNRKGTSEDEIWGVLDPVSSSNLIGTTDANRGGGLVDGQLNNQVGIDWKKVLANDGSSAALQDNGGPTRTIALASRSPALDKGNPSLLPSGTMTDQRGRPRIFGDSIDIGAVESQITRDSRLTVTTLSDIIDNSDGELSLREAIIESNQSPEVEEITFSETLVINGPATVAITQGDLVVSDAVSIMGLGTNLLTIDSQQTSRIFDLSAGAGDVTIQDLTLTGGQTPVGESGGAIRSFVSGTLTISDSVISGNAAEKDGGGIASHGGLLVSHSTINNNTATNGGGGISHRDTTGQADIVSSTINANDSAFGGGLMNFNAVMNLLNSTISGNTTTSLGGGIVNVSDQAGNVASLLVLQSTITQNTTGAGGAIHSGTQRGATFAEVEIGNTLIVQQIDGDNVTLFNQAGSSGATVTSLGHNLADGFAIGLSATGDRTDIAVDVLDTVLKDNGGTTETHRLLAGSPAIDAGDPSLVPANLTLDQRGEPRLFGNTVDVGAFELGSAPPPTYSVADLSSTFVAESGTQATFTVVLDAPPLTNVVFDITSNDTSEASVSPASLTFTPSNWNTPQTVTITGVDDSIADGTQATTVSVSVNAAASDDAYSTLAAQTLTVNTIDDEFQPPDSLVSIDLEITDLDGNPIAGNEVTIGDQFRLNAIVTDLREGSAAEGVFAAHLDVAYTNPTAFSVIASERQRLVFTPETTGGSFAVTFQGTTVPPIAFSSDIESVADDLRQALESHPDIGIGNVRVVGYEKFNSIELDVIFINDLAEMDLPTVQVDWSGLVASSGSPAVTVQTIANADRTEANWFRDAFIPGLHFPIWFRAGEGDGNDPNVFNDVGSIANLFSDRKLVASGLLWSVDLRASSTGEIEFMGNPAENIDSVILFPREEILPFDLVAYGSTQITVVDGNPLPPGETQITLEGGNVVTRHNGNVIRTIARDSMQELVLQGGDQDETLGVGDLGLHNDVAVFIGFDGRGGVDTFRLLGDAQTLDLSSVATVSLQNVEFIDISGSGGNSLKMSESDVASLPDEGQTLHVMMNRDDAIEITDGEFRITNGSVANGQFFVEAQSSSGTLVRVGGLGWTNPLDRFDVSADGFITALDALRIINTLNSGELFQPGSDATLIDPKDSTIPFLLNFVDTTADGSLTALDALRVINHLNERDAGAEPLGDLFETSLFSAPPSAESDPLSRKRKSWHERDPIETLSGTQRKLVSVQADGPLRDEAPKPIDEPDALGWPRDSGSQETSETDRLNAVDEAFACFT